MMCVIWMFSQCKGPESQDETTAEETAYHPGISGFTSGTISATSSIRVLLHQELTRDVEPMTPIPEKLFSFSPTIEGEAYWVDNKTIGFRPEGPLPSGQHFKAEFSIGQLMELPAGQRVFSFSFNVIPQSFALELKGFEAYDVYDPTLNGVNGVMHTADFLSHETAAAMINATQNGRALPVRWEHDAAGREHTFRIDSVQRLETPAEVLVEVEGQPAGIEQKEQQTLNIPSIGDFSLVDVQVVQQPEQYVAVVFSDPLKKNQNLEGLIHFQEDQNLRFLIEGSQVRVYPGARLQGTRQLHIEEGIRSHHDYRFSKPVVHTLAFEDIKPALRLTGKGVIMPESEGLIFPFEAVNLSKVDVRVIRIYEDNVTQFLQENQLSGGYEIKRAGRLIHRQTITLSSDRPLDTGKWNAFSLDLARIIKTEPGAIYRVELGFVKSYSTWPCPDQPQVEDDLTSMNPSFDDELDEEMAYWDAPNARYDGYDNYYDWNWREEDNPCHDAYYGTRRWVSRNVLASDLGLIAKAGTDNSMTFAVTDLSTTDPIPDVTLEVYNFQQQLIASVFTDNQGLAAVKLDSKPFLLIAKHQQQRGYLRLDDASSLSLSRFDVDGNKIQHGIKGFIYGERGVWRPGDSLFVMFVLEDRLRQLPADHPVVFEMINPMGQVVQRMSRTQGQNGFYRFSTATGNDAPTGNWRGKVTVGGVTFSKILKVEAIKPNRLKIDIDFGKEKLVAGSEESATLKVNWLHGAVARNLRAHVAVTLQQVPTQFSGYKGFVFDDPSRSFSSEEITIFDGRINQQGQAEVAPDFGVKSSAPGMLKAGFVVRVFEESGDFSIDRFSMPYSPFQYYVGIRPPEGRGYNNMLVTDADHTIEVVTVDAEGQPVSRNDLEVQVYKIEWRWWWDASENNLASYIGSSRAQQVHSGKIATTNGKGEFVFRINEPEWGRYLVRVSDPRGGHSTGKVLYIDWPGWAARARTQDPSAAAMLAFALDKEKYQVGDPVQVTIPAGHEGRVLVSLETGSRVLRAFWAQANGAETTVNFQATPEMAPNAYVHVSLVQPHSRMTNDLPIRLYGVMPLFVEDPATILQPLIKMPESLTPEENAEVHITEANGKKMTYTIAMVDEGLLDLTRFATPDAWSSFYAREALGVRTWDMYDHVLGAFGGRIEKVFSIGGDEDAGGKPEVQANRFPPMVRFMGPFTLEKGKTNKHSVSIPKYVGSVRVMVVAGDQGAYGKAEKTVPVKKPLMVLATLPRVLTPAETVKLPVTVFAMDQSIREVNVEVKTNELLQVKGESIRKVAFTQTGDQVVHFELDVTPSIGIGAVKVKVSSGKERAEYDIEIDVRNPNLPGSWFSGKVLEPGQQWSMEYQPVGIEGTNSGVLEISSIPPVDFGRRLKYLIGYPHGCAEQVTSGAFPQLVLETVMEIAPDMKVRLQQNVMEGLRTLASYQRPSGGIGYWPGAREASDWATTYAGHFMLEAGAKGFSLPVGMRANWLRYQRGEARKWSPSTSPNAGYYRFDHEDLKQAYRLYTLALAGAPEMGAMNRLRETSGLSVQARWRLAGAYALAGQPEAAEKLIDGIPMSVESYPAFNRTYGSKERDLAMILETLTLMNRREQAVPLLQELSDALSGQQWMSTQTTAYCLLAVAKFAGQDEATTNRMKYAYQLDGSKTVQGVSQLPMVQVPLEINATEAGSVMVKNEGQAVMFARLTLTGTPRVGDVKAQESNLKIRVRYLDMKGNLLDVRKLPQGTDFMAEVSVVNPGQLGHYTDMVLSQVFASGWEIHNARMDEVPTIREASVPTYEDIRDDRVYTHFDLESGATKKFVVVLNAAYLGRFFLPGPACEAMYNHSVSARQPGQWVEVVTPGMQE